MSFWSKMAKFWSFLDKKGQILNFRQKSETALFYIYKAKASWEKSEKSDASVWTYEQKQWFGAILAKNGQFWTIFGQKRANFEFLPKSETVTFLQLRSHSFMRKIWCADFSEMNNVRTYGRESIGLQESRFLETKKVSSHN